MGHFEIRKALTISASAFLIGARNGTRTRTTVMVKGF